MSCVPFRPSFQLTVTGHYLRLEQAELAGYRHLFDTDFSSSLAVNNVTYLINSWGDLCYKSDPGHPAVFVFVKDGVKQVSALPCKGGHSSSNGTVWRLNQPGWPRKPSLTDVVYEKR